MAKVNWLELLKESQFKHPSAQEPPEPEPWEGVPSSDMLEIVDEVNLVNDGVLSQLEQSQIYTQTMMNEKKAQSKAKKESKSMSKDVYNLARLSRGETGMTVYFLFDAVKDMPDTITWVWADGVESVHNKSSSQSKKQDTTKEWWEEHVKNAPFPSSLLVEDLYNDIWVPVTTATKRYEIVEKKHTKKKPSVAIYGNLEKMQGEPGPEPTFPGGNGAQVSETPTGDVYLTKLDADGTPTGEKIQVAQGGLAVTWNVNNNSSWGALDASQIIHQIQHVKNQYYTMYKHGMYGQGTGHGAL